MNLYYAPIFAPAAMYTAQKSRWIAAALHANPIANVTLIKPTSAADLLDHAHTRTYITAVRTGHPRALAESNGFAWTDANWRAACASTGGVVDAAWAAANTREHTGSLSSGLHHARADSGAEFCTFNGLAVAAIDVVRSGRRVLVLDLDAHCGGGTVSILDQRLLPAERGGVVHVDVSVSHFDGHPVTHDGESLDVVSHAVEYLPTIARRLEALRASFDVVIYNAGMDPHEHDAVGGLDGITDAVLAERERLVFAWARARQLPVAFALAGGYTGGAHSPAAVVDLHRLTVRAAAM